MRFMRYSKNVLTSMLLLKLETNVKKKKKVESSRHIEPTAPVESPLPL